MSNSVRNISITNGALKSDAPQHAPFANKAIVFTYENNGAMAHLFLYIKLGEVKGTWGNKRWKCQKMRHLLLKPLSAKGGTMAHACATFFQWRADNLTLSKLESLLLFSVLEIAPVSDRWASDCRTALYGPSNDPAAGRLRDKVFRQTCLGAAFRRTALGQFPWQARGGVAWFLEICAVAPADVAALAAWITPESPRPITMDLSAMGLACPGIRVLGPGRHGWDSWLADVAEAQYVTTAATPLSEAERTYGDETVVQKTGAAQAAAEVAKAADVQLTMPDAPAAEPKTVLIKPRAAIKKARLASAAAQGGLF